MRAVIVLPTYNERENVAPLLSALRTEFESMPQHDMHVLVVDDSSPDGTADVVRSIQQESPNLHLLLGQKKGLGAAYIRGIEHAVGELAADWVIQMDADFSHCPSDLRWLLVNVEHGADVVIGSRYVPGGTIPAEWGWRRRANSLCGNIVARHLAGLHRVRDCTAGFRAIRASLLRKLDLRALRVQGYAFQVALLHEAVIAGARVVELPVDFVDRRAGESKLGVRDIVEFAFNALQIRLRTNETFLKFALVGLTGVVVNVGLFAVLLATGANKFMASPLAVETSILTNFFLNNHWTFRSRPKTSSLRVRGLRFNAVSLLALSISFGTFSLLQFLKPTGSAIVHQMIGIVPAMLVNYFMNSYWTFQDKRAAVNQRRRGTAGTPVAASVSPAARPGIERS